MRRRGLLLLTLAAPIWTARAGITDWFNGVSLGMQIPETDLLYLPAPPDPDAKLLLLDFWATWCAPCRDSIPELNKLYRSFKDQGLAVVGVTDETVEAVERFQRVVPMNYPVGVQQQIKLKQLLGIKALPYAVFVDRNRKVVWRGQPDDIDPALVTALLGAR